MAGGVALGVAELVAGINRNWRSPVLDVGDRIIDNVPPFVKDFAIEQFGTNDKPALLIGIGVALAIYSMIIGALAFTKRLSIGLIGIGLFGLIGIYVAMTRRVDGSFFNAMPTIIGAAMGAVALWAAHHFLISAPEAALGTADDSAREHRATTDVDRNAEPSSTDGERDDADELVFAEAGSGGPSRREMLARSGGVIGALAVIAGGTGAIGRALGGRFSAASSRDEANLSIPQNTLDPIPDGVSVDVEGVSSFITPNDDFYRIDTALTVPQVPTETYKLAITGMVDNPFEMTYDELLDRDTVEHDITLTCVSNTVGGELIGNARWRGVRLDEILAEAGVQSGATQVVGRSVDGYTCGFPIEAATDGRNALVAFGMNGEALPLEHGFPVRLIVPGLYGYISATKWLTEIELTTFEDFESYWVPRGYADRAPIKLMSRIDSVDGLGTLTVGDDGMAAIGGVAWAQTRGIDSVEVQIDDGEWQPADMGDKLNDDTWRQWAFRFEPAARDRARTSIRCRAIDSNGEVQTDERTEPLPNGASGHHQIIVFIE